MRNVLKGLFALFTFAVFSGIPFAFSALSSFSITPANAVPVITTTCTNPLVATDGSYTVVSFKTVESCTWTPPAANLGVEYLIVGGGGGGGMGGGGAGGLLAGTTTTGAVSANSIVVGAGGAGGGNISASGQDGGNSQALGITAIGGGGGGGYGSVGRNGGSGGGNSSEIWAGNLVSTSTVGQGNPGGLGSMGSAGGGGAGAVGTTSSPEGNRDGGNGGNGLSNSITGTSTYYSGGGGGMCTGGCSTGSSGGTGGGGAGAKGRYLNDDTAGLANTGGGGGGADGGSAGGSGVVIVRFLTSAIVVNEPMILTATATSPNPPVTNSSTMRIPMSGTVTNISIDWGDGTVEGPYSAAYEAVHTYASPGTYTVTVSGSKLTKFGNYCRSTPALTAVQSWGDLGITDLSHAFCNAKNLTHVPSTLPSTVTKLEAMFLYAEKFNQNISTWNTSNVSTMTAMFRGALAFNNGSANNDGLNPMTSTSGGWNTSSVVSFAEMFLGATSFNQNVSSWDTSKATTAPNFSGATAFNNGSATDDSSNPLLADGNKWNLAKVSNFSNMFRGASSFNQSISNWNIAGPTIANANLTAMFENAVRFNQDLGQLNMSKASNVSYMVANTAISSSNYDALLNGWANQTTRNNLNLNSSLRYTTAGQAGRDVLTGTRGWTITDGGVAISTPTITIWPSAGGIVSGQSLSDVLLTGGSASVPGSFAFANLNSVPAVGSSSHQVVFTPTDSTNYTTVTSSGNSNVTVVVSRATPTVTTWPSAGRIVSGQSLSDVLLTGGSASVPGSFAFANLNTVPAVGSATHQMVFTPTDTTNYTTVTSSGNSNVTVVVARATPTVTTWPSAGGIVSGQSLSDVLLTGGSASVPGSFAFANLNTVPAVGSSTHQIVFTPTDSTNYTTVTSSGNSNVTVVVSRATPTVSTWPSASGIVTGQSLSDSVLTGGRASVPGSFAFANLNTVPAVGSATHQVIFTPTDTTNYTSVTSSNNTNVSVLVSQAQPVVSRWPSVADLISGQSLTDGELNGGQANVPGRFTLANPGGTPGVGNFTVEVIFVPNDAVNYIAVTSSIQVNVIAPTPTPTPEPTPTPTPTVNASGLEVINPVADAPLQVAETTVTAVTLVAAVSAAAAATTAVTAVAAAAGTAASAAASAAGSAAGSAAASAGGGGAASSASNSAGRSPTTSSSSSTSSGSSSTSSSSSNSKGSDTLRSEDSRSDKFVDDELLELKKIRSGDMSADLDASTKWGDNLPLWSTAAFVALDKPSVKITHRSAPKSPFTAKLIAESAYLRAALGSAFIALPIVSVLAALIGLQQINGLFLPPEATALSVILVIGVLDGFAGLLGMLTFGIGLIINPGITTPSDLRMLLGLSLLGFAPGMLASAFRNLRRPEAITSHQIYERAVDLIVAPFLAGWATLGIVSALPALAGAELPIQESANLLAWCAAITMFVRVLLEELAVKYFPKRSRELNPADLNTPSMKQKVISLFLRMGLFFFVSMAFVGHCWQLYAGTIIFIIPSFVGLYRDKFPNYPKLYQILPSGLPGLGFALLIASASLVVLQSLFGETPEFAKIAFVLLPIPGLIFSLLGILGRAPHDGDVRWYMRPKNLWVYRLGGVLVLLGTLRLTNII